MTDIHAPFRLGWEEWCALPALGLPALKVKVDTGARRSALHAFDIEPFGPAEAPHLRFGLHPVPGRDDLVIHCSAPLKDRRDVTSSNGETESRYVIETDMVMGERRWPIEITLTDRTTMAYRMLLGRQAVLDDMVVDPNASFCQPELDYDVYAGAQLRAATPPRALRIAVLSREAESYSTQRLVDIGEMRGHTVEVIDTTRCYIAINALAPEVHYDGPKVLEVNSSPGLEGIEKTSGKDIAGAIFDEIERRVRPAPVRKRKT